MSQKRVTKLRVSKAHFTGQDSKVSMFKEEVRKIFDHKYIHGDKRNLRLVH